ncbi:MAG: glycosyltransferase family 39 protein [Vicinamibacteria bacterium]|nr:glycosyltransferase family 39 protein [Vicinamibacteria bacterium]
MVEAMNVTGASVSGKNGGGWSRPLLLLTFGGLIVRLLFVCLEPSSRLVGDETTWVGWALKDLEGLLSDRVQFSPFRSEMLFYPPLYPYFIAAFHALFGGLTAVKLAQAVIGTALVPAVGRLGIRVFGERAGLLAAAIVAFYPELVWYTGHFWSETLFLALMFWSFERVITADDARPAPSVDKARKVRAILVILWIYPPVAVWMALEHRQALVAGGVFVIAALSGWLLLLRLTSSADPSRARLLTAGVLWGLAILTRETLLYFTPIVMLWLLFRRSQGVARSLVFGAAAFLVVAPWTYRNTVVYRAFVPVATSGALNLWQGNTRLSRHEVYARTEEIRGETLLQNRVTQWRFHRRMAVAAIANRQPWWIFEKLRDEMPSFWEADSLALIHLKRRAYGYFSPRAVWIVAFLMIVPYLVVLAFAVPGIAGAPVTRTTVLLLAFLLYYNGIHVVTHGFSRYRLPVMPVVFLFAVFAWSSWTERRPLLAGFRRRFVAFVLAAAFVAILIPSIKRQMGDATFRNGASVGFDHRTRFSGGDAHH